MLVLLCERARSLEEQARDIAHTRAVDLFGWFVTPPAGYAHSHALQRFLYFCTIVPTLARLLLLSVFYCCLLKRSPVLPRFASSPCRVHFGDG